MKIVYMASVDVSEFNAPASHVKECVRVMAKQHDVTLISARRKVFQRAANFYGVRTASVAFPALNGGWRYFERRVAGILRRMDVANGDIVYLRTSPSRVIARALCEMACTKVLEVNGMEASSHAHFSSMLDAVDVVLVGTESTKLSLTASFPEFASKVVVHSNIGIDVAHFHPKHRLVARKSLCLPEEGRLGIHVSGFQPHHDFNTLLRSVEVMAGERGDFKLILLGDGERRAAVRSSASALVEAGIVIFPGAVGAEALSNYIAAADVCINAMTMEKLKHGNGNAQKTMEYLACARAVIETVDPAQDVPSWLAENALCIPPGDVSAMVGAIGDVLEQQISWEQKAMAARDLLLSTHSWDAVVAHTLSVIEQRCSRVGE